MRITVDTDFMDDTVILVPDQFLDPQQTRELQNVFQEKRIIILPPGKIICEEGLETVPVHQER
jgi:hypothetical protein